MATKLLDGNSMLYHSASDCYKCTNVNCLSANLLFHCHVHLANTEG